MSEHKKIRVVGNTTIISVLLGVVGFEVVWYLTGDIGWRTGVAAVIMAGIFAEFIRQMKIIERAGRRGNAAVFQVCGYQGGDGVSIVSRTVVGKNEEYVIKTNGKLTEVHLDLDTDTIVFEREYIENNG